MKLTPEFKNTAKAVAIVLPLLGASAYTVLNTPTQAFFPIIFGYLLNRARQLRYKSKTFKKAEGFHEVTDQIAKRMGFEKTPEIGFSRKPKTSPFSGYDHVVVPNEIFQKNVEEKIRDFVLAHEFAHIQRKDSLPSEAHLSSMMSLGVMTPFYALNLLSPSNYYNSDASNLLACTVALVATNLIWRSIKGTYESRFEAEFDCDRRASLALWDVEGGLSVFQNLGHTQFISHGDGFQETILMPNENWLKDHPTHPSLKKRSQALLKLQKEKGMPEPSTELTFNL